MFLSWLFLDCRQEFLAEVSQDDTFHIPRSHQLLVAQRWRPPASLPLPPVACIRQPTKGVS